MSRKVYVTGSRPDIRVPMREIALTGGNPPVRLYDTSGPYTDPSADLDLKPEEDKRQGWLDDRLQDRCREHGQQRQGRIDAEEQGIRGNRRQHRRRCPQDQHGRQCRGHGHQA